MTAQHSPDLAQLTEAVARLSEVLAAGERRRVASARRLRWGAIALVATVGAIAYAQPGSVQVMTQSWKPESLPMPLPPGAFAEQESYLEGSDPSLHPKGQFQGILPLLGMLKDMTGLDGAMVKVLQSAAGIADSESAADPDFKKCLDARKENNDPSKLCYARTQVQDLGEFFLDAQGKPIDGSTPQGQEDLMAATIMAMGQVVVDGATLMHRLRRDSDRLRYLASEKGLAETMMEVHVDLDRLNGILSVVPAMANEMRVMNANMASMSHSMGSTMGRMGNIMPW